MPGDRGASRPDGGCGRSHSDTVDCTYTNRQRGTIIVHKQDDARNPLAGAVFTLFADNPPLGGDPPHGVEDTSTGKTCTTGADGNCTITEVVPGRYWVVETTGCPATTPPPTRTWSWVPARPSAR